METIIGLENYTFPLLSATIVVAQCICVGWCYGGLRLMSNITAMNNRRNDGEARMFTNAINFITAYLWSLVVPLAIWVSLVLLLADIVSSRHCIWCTCGSEPTALTRTSTWESR